MVVKAVLHCCLIWYLQLFIELDNKMHIVPHIYVRKTQLREVQLPVWVLLKGMPLASAAPVLETSSSTLSS